jgi:hypothetical protein
VDESHFEHTGEVLGGFLKSREDASAFFQPADQSLDDVPLAICLPVKHDRPGVPIFVVLGRNHRCDFQFQQTVVDPIGSVRFVSRQCHRPRNRLTLAVENLGISTVEQRNQGGRFMVLARRQVKVKWMPLSVAQQMDFGGKTPARTA